MIVTARLDKTVTVATKSTLTIQLVCTSIPSGAVQAQLLLSTTADHAGVRGTDDWDGAFENEDFGAADGPVSVGFDFIARQDIANTSFSAVTAAGMTWAVSGFTAIYTSGTPRCVAQLTTAG